MLLRSLVSLLLLACLSPAAFAQLIFDKIPSDLQMFPRDSEGLGWIQVSGRTTDGSVRGLRLVLQMNTDSSSSLFRTEQVPLDEHHGFSVKLAIPARLADYDLRVYVLGQDHQETLYRTIRHLVAGDFFIVSGQSNAAGAMDADRSGFLEDSLFANKYCRTIGTIFQRVAETNSLTGQPLISLEEDTRFRRPSSIYTASGSTGCVGIWPLRLMQQVVSATGVPVCLLNGSKGATELSYHYASHTPYDPSAFPGSEDLSRPFSAYDRLYRKLWTHEALAGVKAVIWYQGESDGTLSREAAETYNQRFARLRRSWKTDYPMLEKIFVFQINTGCGGDHLDRVREQQRKLRTEFEDVIVVPTVGSGPEDRSVDGCHYTLAGNRKLGDKMSPVVLKYLYHSDLREAGIMGPDIQRAYYEKAGLLCLEFDMDISVQQEQYFTFQQEGVAYIRDYFYTEKEKALLPEAVRAEGHKLYLYTGDTLNEISRITYLPNAFSNIPTTYMGPWILNRNNETLGALSFFGFPVEPRFLLAGKDVKDSLVVYPNPVSDYLIVRNLRRSPLVHASVYDYSGRKVLEMDRIQDSEGAHVVDLGTLAAGLYFTHWYFEDGTQIRKRILKR